MFQCGVLADVVVFICRFIVETGCYCFTELYIIGVTYTHDTRHKLASFCSASFRRRFFIPYTSEMKI